VRTSILRSFAAVGFCASAVLEYGFDFDFPLTPSLWLVIAAATFLATTTRATLQTNGWIASGSGKWEASINWSAGTPAITDAVDIVSGGSTLPSTAIIDATTSGSFPGSMTISNLIVRRYGGIGAMKPPGTVSLENAGLLPTFNIWDSCTITVGGTISITNSALSCLSGSSVFSDDGNVVVNNGFLGSFGQFIVGNTGVGQMTISDGTNVSYGPFIVGNSGTGQMMMSGGTLECFDEAFVGMNDGSQGTLTIAGGTAVFNGTLGRNDGLVIGSNALASGSVWVTGGQMLLATSVGIYVGLAGTGQLTVSNGIVQTLGIYVAANAGSQGTLTLAGGTINDSSYLLYLAAGSASTAEVWVTGGQLNTSSATIGASGAAQVTVSNGMWQATAASVGYGGVGTLTIAGGTAAFSLESSVGFSPGSTGAVWLTNGQLLSTNASLFVGENGIGQLTISNGTWRAQGVSITKTIGRGKLTVDGGTTSISSNLAVGSASCSSTATFTMTAGSVFVTNASHTAVLEVRGGTVTFSAGTLVIDRLVMTNFCGRFIHTGGTLSITSTNLDPNLSAVGDGIPNGWKQQYGLDPFDPIVAFEDPDGDGLDNYTEYQAGTDPTDPSDPLRITAIDQTNASIAITWQYLSPPANPNSHAIIEASPTVTGAWNNISGTITLPMGFLSIDTTNYFDTGGATNKPTRFYRVRSAP